MIKKMKKKIDRDLDRYFKKLDKILSERDVDGLIQLSGCQGKYCPSREVAEVALHKMTISRGLDKNLVMESRLWLSMRGFSPDIS